MSCYASQNVKTPNRGQLFFSAMSHRLYDFGLYRVVTHFFWQCPTDRLLENYVQHISSEHLEVGVGSGYFLKRTLCSDYVKRLTLLDLNRHCLNKSANRLRDLRPTAIRHDIRNPLKKVRAFKSVGMNYVLHCIPGSFAQNRSIFEHVCNVLQPGGVFFGATLIPNSPNGNFAARFFMKILNAMGIFNNTAHICSELEEILATLFQTVEVEIIGDACVFKAVK